MSATNIYAVAACHRPDVDQMKESLKVLDFPKSRVIIVSNGEDQPTARDFPEATVVKYPTLEYCMPNWWNAGLDFIQGKTKKPHEVFIFNADTIATKGTVVGLAEALREYALAATGPDQSGVIRDPVHVEHRTEAFDLRYRLPGYACMLKGELGLRADPQFRHWYLDDDLEWQARRAGGTGIVQGLRVQHPPNGNPLTPRLTQFADEDREKFKIKWGMYPH